MRNIVFPRHWTTLRKLIWLRATAAAKAIYETISGAIVSFTTVRAAPFRSLSLSLSPIQSLNGYDNPWPAGGGKNLLNWENTTQTINGVTFTVNSDGTVNVNGTADGGDASFYSTPTDKVLLPEGNYVLSGCPSGGNVSTYMINETIYSARDTGSGANISVPQGSTGVRVRIVIKNGTTVSNKLFKPMICLSSASNPTTFAPYSNICPISGWTEVDVTRTGESLLDINTFVQGSISGQGVDTSTTNRLRSPLFAVYPSTKYWVKCNTGVLVYEFHDYDANGKWLGYTTINNTSGVITTRANAKYAKVLMRHLDNSTITTDEVTQFTFAEGETAGEYIPYNGTTLSISFPTPPGTVYSGTLDVVTGVLTVDMGYVDLGTLSWVSAGTNQTGAYRMQSPQITQAKPATSDTTKANILCSNYATVTAEQTYYNNTGIDIGANGRIHVYDPNYNTSTSASAFKTAMDGVLLVYELATPQTYQLTPQEVSSLLGNNVVWQSGNGDVSVTFRSN